MSLVCWLPELRIGLAPAVADGGGFQDVAELVHLQRQRVSDTRIGRVALVVIADGFAGMGEEDRVAILGLAAASAGW